MRDLVFRGTDDQALTNSLLVAEKFGKEHRHVLDSIRELVKGCAENSADLMFKETTYVNSQNNQEYPMFIMNRDGFSLLAMGFTGKRALQFKMEFVNAFNRMESLLRSDDYILARSQEILHNRLQLAEKQLEAAKSTISRQSQQLKDQAPKVEYTDNVLKSVNTYTSTQMAKELDLRTAEQLHGLLKGWGVMIRQSGQWLLAARYCGQGYTKARTITYTRSDGSQGTNTITVWSELGRWFLHQLMAKKGGAQ